MDIIILKIINAYKNLTNFSSVDVDEFQEYTMNTFKYPVGSLLTIITMYSNLTNQVEDYIKDLNYFLTNIGYLYDGIYNQDEQAILANYCALYNYKRVGVEEQIIQNVQSVLNFSSDKLEIQELLKILKYNYTQALILSHSPDQTAIENLFQELEADPPSFELHDLLQFKTN